MTRAPVCKSAKDIYLLKLRGIRRNGLENLFSTVGKKNNSEIYTKRFHFKCTVCAHLNVLRNKTVE